MKPFDIEAAKNGAPVCTRDGKKARIICFDRKGDSPIVALIEIDGVECPYFFTADGVWRYRSRSNLDLFMYEKPEPQFKPFDKVLVRDSTEGEWRTALFSHINKHDDYVCSGSIWNYCIPYNGNEHLLGMTDNPKED